MTSEIVLASAQALGNSQSPDISNPPNFAIVDPRRNWYYYVQVGSPTRSGPSRSYAGTVMSKALQEIVLAAQTRINKAAQQRETRGVQPFYTRDDGVLDVDTLSSGAQELMQSLRPGANDTVTNSVIDAMNASARSGSLSGVAGSKAITGLILLGLLDSDAGGKTMAQIEPWLADGGISLGRSNSAMSEFPRVEQTGTLQRSMPRATNFVRRNKYPIAIGAVAVSAIAVILWMNSSDQQ